MAVKTTSDNGTDETAKTRKPSPPILIAATHDATEMLQVGASVPGTVYDSLVAAAAARDGAVDGDKLVRRFLNEEVQRGIFSHVGVDYDAWYAEYQEARKSTRKSAGAKGGSTKAKAETIGQLISNPDMLVRLTELAKEGKTQAEIMAELFPS